MNYLSYLCLVGFTCIVGSFLIVWAVMSHCDRKAKQEHATKIARGSSKWQLAIKRLSPGVRFEYMGIKMTVTHAYDEIDVSEECWEPGGLVAEYVDSCGVIRTKDFQMNQSSLLLAVSIVS